MTNAKLVNTVATSLPVSVKTPRDPTHAPVKAVTGIAEKEKLAQVVIYMLQLNLGKHIDFR